MSERTEVLLEKVNPDPNNPRQEFDPVELDKLEVSIRKDGIINPLVVEKNGNEYLLVDGERRYRAAKKIGLKKVPVTVVDAMSDIERLVKRFQIQERHTNWTLFEKALAIANLQAETGMTVGDLVNVLGFSQGQLEKYIMAGMLSKRAAQEISAKKLPYDYVVVIGSILKSVEDGSKRLDVEEALLQKINDRVVLNSKELRKYKAAIIVAGDAIIEKIVSDKRYSPLQVMKDSKTENLEAFKYLNHSTWAIEYYGEKILLRNNPTISKSLHEKLINVKKIVDDLIDCNYEDFGRGSSYLKKMKRSNKK